MIEQVQERILSAHEKKQRLRIEGRSSWMSAGRPVDSTDTISVASLNGIVDYVPGDLTITVRAGTTLKEISSTTGEQRQWLPINPHGSDEGSIGATVATGSYGPLVHGFGTIRDLVLGLQIVTGDGRVIRGGGRVVKNVAGFDIVRLMTGAWGTLGVITEVTLRLYSQPATRQTVAMEAPTETRRLAERIRALQDAPIIPFAMELLSTRTARSVGLPARPMILIELGGNSAAVASQTDALRKLGALVEATPGMWDSLRKSEDKECTVFRISGLPAHLAEGWERAERMLEATDGALMHATLARGIVRCIVPGSLSHEVQASLSESEPHDTMILERAPAELWNAISPSAIADTVSQNLKRAFDRHDILNPGILGALN